MGHRVRAQLPSLGNELAQLAAGHHRAVAARTDPRARPIDETDRHVHGGLDRVLAQDRQRHLVVVAHAVVEGQCRQAGRRHAAGAEPCQLGQRDEAEAGGQQHLDLRAKAIGGHEQHAEVIAPARRRHAVIAEHDRAAPADLRERVDGGRHVDGDAAPRGADARRAIRARSWSSAVLTTEKSSENALRS